MSEANEFEKYNASVDLATLPLYTRAQLAVFDGVTDPKLYVGIRGVIYDVSANAKSYGPGKSYNKLVGKDAARLLGLSKLTLKESDAHSTQPWYTDDLTEKQHSTVDQWSKFFSKRYYIVGVVAEHGDN